MEIIENISEENNTPYGIVLENSASFLTQGKNAGVGEKTGGYWPFPQ